MWCVCAVTSFSTIFISVACFPSSCMSSALLDVTQYKEQTSEQRSKNEQQDIFPPSMNNVTQTKRFDKWSTK